MLSFPNCKINLGLHILNKREDGYHNLETIFYPINFREALEIIPTQNPFNSIEFSNTGLTVTGNTEENICIKAYHLLKKDFTALPEIKMHLHKAIPMGAGLGGGSADGAFTLQLLNKKFTLNLTKTDLLKYAVRLGSDCPFFIINKPCFAAGRGEILEEINISLSTYKIVLVNPGIHVNTGWAFAQLTPATPLKSIKEIINQPITTWKQELKNDFEKPVFEKYPAIKKIKETMYVQGALYAAMSGSGSTVYGIFNNEIDETVFKRENYSFKVITNSTP